MKSRLRKMFRQHWDCVNLEKGMEQDFREQFPWRNAPLLALGFTVVSLFLLLVITCFVMWIVYGLAGISTTLLFAFVLAVPTSFVVAAAFFGVAPDATSTIVVISLFLFVGLSITTVKIQAIREHARRVSCMNNLREFAIQALEEERGIPTFNAEFPAREDPFLDQLRLESELRPISRSVFDQLRSYEQIAVIDLAPEGARLDSLAEVEEPSTSEERYEGRYEGRFERLYELDYSEFTQGETVINFIRGRSEDQKRD